MSKHKYTNVVCIAVVVVVLVITVAFMYSPNLGVTVAHTQPEYASALFSTDKVHTIDIQVKDSDWDAMIENAQAEEYIQATVIIDGEEVSGVGLRPKGNSSLSMIASSDSDRYSFKIEFDHYSNKINYHGLDKLALNNIAQDNTYMKDYVSYQMMNEMGADAPLSSFIWVTVNGEDWGLYLAAEAIEESFAQRVYGNDFGEIYKPDSMDMNDRGEAGGFGDGRGENGENAEGGFPGRGQRNFDGENGEMPRIPNVGGENGEMPDFGNMPGIGGENGEMPNIGGGRGGMFGGGGATSLVYTDDDPDSYAAIFDGAAFKTSDADKTRLIASLKQLNEGENIEQVINVDEVIRYFVVHNFVLNSDSYTGSMIHNYYLSEKNGQLSMIAWDYNLAFGGMGGMGRMGGGGNNAQTATDTSATTDQATTLVNYPIDTPLLSGSMEDKPMIAWIFNNEEYLEKYHEIYAEYMEYFSSGKFAEMYDNAISLISPYVEKDPTAFCTYEDFQKGSSALRDFCLLRAESIIDQLDGTIAATSDGQTATSHANFVDASSIDLESMGSNSMGFGRARGGGQFPGRDGNADNTESNATGSEETTTDGATITEGGGAFVPPDGGAGFPGGGEFTPPGGGAGFPDGGQFSPPEGQANFPADGNFPQMNADTQIAPAAQENAEQGAANNQAQAFRNMDMRSSGNTATSSFSLSNVILLSACVIVLIGGILFVKKIWV
jgi:spore coat protein CotH